MTAAQYKFDRLEPPIPEAQSRDLIAFWKNIFQGDMPGLADILAGKENRTSRNSLYLAECRGKTVATCRMGVSVQDPRLACLGEVATDPEHRGQHLAAKLCAQAVEEFERASGQAFFLGTVNPVAAKVYTRLGWRFLAGTQVMLRTSPDTTPEEFLVDYFRHGRDLPVSVGPGSPAHRIPMIPLILTPHEWMVLDANTTIFSTRYVVQKSCEGLFPRYQYLPSPAAWFAATRSDGAVVGLASAQIREDKTASVDAFAHYHYQDRVIADLYRQAADWARSQNATAVFTTAARHDPPKQEVLTKIGFKPDGRTFTVRSEASPLELTIFDIPMSRR